MRLDCRIVCLLTLAVTLPASATTVSGSSSIWLAGQPAGTSVTGYFGSDTATTNSPVQFAIGGNSVAFAATGSTSVDGVCFAGPGGGCYTDQSGFSPAPWGSNYNGPADALIGIFTNGTPSLTTSNGFTGPVFAGGPDYQNPANIGAGTYSPLLDQIFYIGDGTGETFVVPTGATELYLGVADSLGGSTGNSGSLAVTTSFSGNGTAATPEPGSLVLFGTGMVGLAGMVRRRLS